MLRYNDKAMDVRLSALVAASSEVDLAYKNRLPERQKNYKGQSCLGFSMRPHLHHLGWRVCISEEIYP